MGGKKKKKEFQNETQARIQKIFPEGVQPYVRKQPLHTPEY